MEVASSRVVYESELINGTANSIPDVGLDSTSESVAVVPTTHGAESRRAPR